MKAYLDTSVLLRRVLGERGAFRDWERFEKCYTSEITLIESSRTLDRLRLEGRLSDAGVSERRRLLREMFQAVGLIGLNKVVLERAAGAFPTIVGTLDAIHLASAWLYGERRKEPLSFLTHDLRLATAAQALGFEVLGVGPLERG